MKLTTLILITAILQVSASTYAQRITLSEKNAPLITVLKQIRMQSGYDFLFKTATLKDSKAVSIDVNNVELKDLLEIIFKDQPLDYKINKKSVVISIKEDSFIDRVMEHFSNIDVQGIVKDEQGNLMPGASVKVKGTSLVTTTNANGEFRLNNVSENAVIVISFIGYEPKEIKAKTNLGSITLTLANSKLDDVQVIGYGTTTKRFNTGNVITVTAEDIEKQPVTNALLALEGRAPGLFITQNTGLPNSTVKVQIRGTNSMTQSTDPLYIIDGVPYTSQMLTNVGSFGSGESSPFSFINPSTVESIDILKDADATAIYGSKGANGVILVTTKKGKEGPAKFDVNIYTGISEIPSKVDLMNKDQYLEMRNEAFKNTGAAKTTSNAPDLLLWDPNRNDDWQKRLLGHITLNTDAEISMSGGTANSSYRVYGGYNKTTPPFPGDFNSQKVSGGVNLTTSSIDKRFNAQISVAYLFDQTFLPSYDPTSAIMIAPVAPEPINPDGSMNYKDYPSGNPYPGFYNTYKGKTYNLATSGSLSYKILPELLFKVTGGYNNNTVIGAYAYSIAAQIGDPYITNPTGSASFSNNLISSWIAEPQLSYHREIGKGKLEVMIGTTFQQDNSNGEIIAADGYANDALLGNLAAAANIYKGSSTYGENKFNSVYGRLNYNLQDKYLMNFTGRRDGSSRFGPDSKFGNFGAVGLGWIFSKENIIADHLPFLSFGKIRASYGTTGNQPGSDYQYLSLHSFYTLPQRNYQNSQSISADNLLSPDYRWEQVKKMEGGLELGVFKDRILASVSYFQNRSSNQLIQYELPAITGFASVLLNRDATVQNTGTEITLSSQNINASGFTWETNFNMTFSRNKLLAFPGIEKTPYATSLIVGQPLSIQPHYRAAGVDPQTGVYQFYDKNGNLTFAPGADDATALISTDPKFYGGLQNSFTYKNFGLDLFFQFVKQMGANYFYRSLDAPGYSYYGDGNQPAELIHRWQKPGDIATYQKYTSSYNNVATAYSYQQYSDAAYTDASFIRLKNVSFSYKLPKDFLQKLKIDQARFYFQAQNLFTITKYKGLDPEGQGTLPPLSAWTFGTQFTF